MSDCECCYKWKYCNLIEAEEISNKLFVHHWRARIVIFQHSHMVLARIGRSLCHRKGHLMHSSHKLGNKTTCCLAHT